jgi:hypothetical protein
MSHSFHLLSPDNKIGERGCSHAKQKIGQGSAHAPFFGLQAQRSSRSLMQQP